MKLIAYSSTESGGMTGNYSSTSVTRTRDGRCRVEIARKDFHSEPLRRVKYYADGLLEKIGEVCERYEIINWTDLPELDIFMHDASRHSQSFIFEHGPDIILDSKKMIPPAAHEMYQEIDRLILESESYGTDVEITEDTPLPPMGMMAWQTEQTAKVQDSGSPDTGTSRWAKFCTSCGTRFHEEQKFCAECGSSRKKY